MKHDLMDMENGLLAEDVCVDYAAGRLSPARRLLVACQMAINPAVRKQVEAYESFGGALVEANAATGLTSGFLNRALNAAFNAPEVEEDTTWDGEAVRPLAAYMGKSLKDVKWRSVGGGVSVHKLFGKDDAERIFLLKAKPGSSIPDHSHTGEEWTLIMQGAYNIGDKRYQAGDLHIEDENTHHQPIIQDGEDCICLAMTEGPLRFKGFIPRLLQPMSGI